MSMKENTQMVSRLHAFRMDVRCDIYYSVNAIYDSKDYWIEAFMAFLNKKDKFCLSDSRKFDGAEIGNQDVSRFQFFRWGSFLQLCGD